ncbi:TolB family protein [Streptomyces sp. NPDC051738]|uniref:TolB family protein n=1 Tax=Streptomyces sp. NPDC051738 TaxID=3365672 RepID=UPI0037CEF99F
MSRAARVSGVCSGTALLLAFTGTTAAAAPHAPRVERVSTAADGTQADGPPNGAAISADGRHVAFTSTAPSFGCARFTPCLLVKDLDTGALEKAAEHATAPSLSVDGRKVAFQRGRDVHVRDLDTGITNRVKGAQPSLAGDGTRVAYTVGGAVYLLELATGERQLISVDCWGGRGDLPAGKPSVNADGTVVAFESASPDLVEGDTNGVSDVFLRTVQ